MTRRVPEDPSKSSNSRASATEQKLKDLLSASLGNSPAIGFAVCDRRLRFRLVNNAWARMDGVSRDAHLGATIRSVLGPAAKQFQLAFERVFSSGNPLLGYEFSAEFPSRTGEAHWIASCFPIKDTTERLTLAAALVWKLHNSEISRCGLTIASRFSTDLGTRFPTKEPISDTSLGRQPAPLRYGVRKSSPLASGRSFSSWR